MKNILYALIFAFSAMFVSPTFAADSAQAESFISEVIQAKPSDTDLADKSFAQLFGKFVFKPFGGYPGGAEEATTLAQVLGYSNIVAMILGVIILSYTILGGALKTAADGQLLGQGWSSVWLPLRTATAFGMITPVSDGSGVFSVAQSLVIWMVIVGSNAGTWVWEKGAVLLTVGSPTIPTAMVYDYNSFKDIAGVLHCSVIRNEYFKEKGLASKTVGTAHFSYVAGGAKTGAFNYSSGYTLNFGDISKLTSISFDGCGSIAFPASMTNDAMAGTQSTSTFLHNAFNKQDWEKKIADNFKGSVPTAYMTFLNSVLAQAVTLSKGPSAAEISAARTNYNTNAADKAIYDQIATSGAALDTVAASYASYISASKTAIVTPDIAAAWKKTMTEGGWMAAGVWFFEASKLQATVYNYLNKLTTGATYSPDAKSWVAGCGWFKSGSCDDSLKDQESKLARLEELKQYTSSSGASDAANGIIGITSGANGIDVGFFDIASVSIAQTFMNGLTFMGSSSSVGEGVGSNSGMTENTSGMISPFTALSSMGRGLQNINEVIWGIGLAAMAFSKGLEGSILSQVGAAAGSGAINYIVMTLVPLMGALLGMSFIMAMGIPFTPVVTWILMCCGYLLTVIEAVAAAPLAVIMMATPEGDGLAGQNLQRALQLVNAIVLRPTLSILGLFAAMTLSYVGFSLMNTMFWKVAGLSTSLGLYEIIGLISIYISISLNLCRYMISVMHKIPDQILGWMGGGVTPFGESADHVGEGLKSPGSLNGNAIKAMQAGRDRQHQANQREFFKDMAEQMKQKKEQDGSSGSA
ncbi:DotA/TraY family protein [Pseudomonas fluorescens]|uniref:DotA/TraY family protein n=1 Tax=Pseudomonas TaxID=286 RepID=UPI000F03E41C|nr:MULTISPECIES: DotA/TraY family protein [Pseudomonas]MBD8089250.1 DotA/TraY family protein [Pseudomonas fluorescens]MBD8615323.1 DotA/TraY family protein [Pseudomonas putida]MBD8682023.1 DotA/TraY family protein [Pseudomonas sp. CFBP 13719]